MRPRQWTKNLIIYFALFFTVDQAWSLSDLGEAYRTFALITAAAAIFCLVTSAVYLVNDVLDAERDRHHPRRSSTGPSPRALCRRWRPWRWR